MFPDPILSGQDTENNFFQTTSPILIPLSNANNQDSFMNLISVSTDDEHSISSNSTSSRRQRLFSSFEVNIFYIQLVCFKNNLYLQSDSVTRDSELTFDEHFIETKLEKVFNRKRN
jgi:hypothetical protein